MDEWMDRLRAQTGEIRPTGVARTRVVDELARRRLRRHGLTAVAGVASVAVVVGAVAFVPRALDREVASPADPAISAPSTAAVTPTEPVPSSMLPVFTCPLDNPVFTDRPPPGTRPLDNRVLDPVLHYARRATRGVGGLAGFAYWDKAGAILVQWESPVPETVRSLEDVQFEFGGQIIVRGVTYSAADLRRAQKALQGWLRQTGWRDHWSFSSYCGDFSGLGVGLTPASLADVDIPALQREIADAIGVPARVVPEELPINRPVER